MGIDIDEAKVARNETGLWLGWALATMLGLMIGYLPAALLVDQMDLGLARVLIPLLAGLLIGLAQWMVLRNYLTHSAHWVFHLTGSWVVGYSLGLLIINWLSGSAAGLIFGATIFGVVVALLQWPVFRREMPHIWMWALANVVGWGLGALLSQWVLVRLFAGTHDNLVSTTLVNAAVTGLVAGLITGLALVWIVRKPEKTPIQAVNGGQ